VLDGTEAAAQRLQSMLFFDVNNGIARRAWARNSGSIEAIQREMDRSPQLRVTIPQLVEDRFIDNLIP
jgi:urocanate hydratase